VRIRTANMKNGRKALTTARVSRQRHCRCALPACADHTEVEPLQCLTHPISHAASWLCPQTPPLHRLTQLFSANSSCSEQDPRGGQGHPSRGRPLCAGPSLLLPLAARLMYEFQSSQIRLPLPKRASLSSSMNLLK